MLTLLDFSSQRRKQNEKDVFILGRCVEFLLIPRGPLHIALQSGRAVRDSLSTHPQAMCSNPITPKKESILKLMMLSNHKNSPNSWKPFNDVNFIEIMIPSIHNDHCRTQVMISMIRKSDDFSKGPAQNRALFESEAIRTISHYNTLTC